MTAALAAPSSASTLWFLNRGTGVVSLLLLTLVLVLGVLSRGGRALPGLPRFVTPALHRNISLFSLVLLAVHIGTAVADPFAPIHMIDVVVPFASAYRPIWVGFGALSLDILLALIVTSLLRERVGRRAWRMVHWAAYAAWPAAVVHGLGTGTDTRQVLVLALVAVASASAFAAVVWRIRRLGAGTLRQQRTAVGLTVAVPVAVMGWAMVGPLAPHWAARAGTPANLLAASGSHTARPATTDSSLSATLPRGQGQIHGQVVANQAGQLATITLRSPLTGGPGGRLRITLRGFPTGQQGISLSNGSVSYYRGAGAYTGPVTGLNGGEIDAALSGPAGHVHVVATVTIDAAQAFAGTVTMS